MLARTAAWCADRAPEFDFCGQDAVIEEFAARVAKLLGFPVARFMPSGKVAQNVALRVWSERAANRCDVPSFSRYEWTIVGAACAFESGELAQLFERFSELAG